MKFLSSNFHRFLSSLLMSAMLFSGAAYAEIVSTKSSASKAESTNQVAQQSAHTESSQVAVTGAVNINTADEQTLVDKLVGIGPAKAKAIIAYREEHGPFASVDALLEVKGIGPATLEKNRALLTIN